MSKHRAWEPESKGSKAASWAIGIGIILFMGLGLGAALVGNDPGPTCSQAGMCTP